jgi:methylase of polypeptide subunit release factors
MEHTAVRPRERAGGGKFPGEGLRPRTKIYSSASERPSERWAERFAQRASVYWEKFFRRNGPHFFKDRHYLLDEWPELAKPCALALESGCGSGSTVVPLLLANPSINVVACDFSPSAVQFTCQRAREHGVVRLSRAASILAL